MYIDNPELYQKVESAIESLRPFFEADQGDIRLVGIDRDLIARVQLLGACKTCNSGIQQVLQPPRRGIAPEIKSVEAID